MNHFSPDNKEAKVEDSLKQFSCNGEGCGGDCYVMCVRNMETHPREHSDSQRVVTYRHIFVEKLTKSSAISRVIYYKR